MTGTSGCGDHRRGAGHRDVHPQDFPARALEPGGIQARHPDDFLMDHLDLLPGGVLQLLTEQAADLQHPPTDLAGILNALQRCGVPDFAEAVRRLAPDDK